MRTCPSYQPLPVIFLSPNIGVVVVQYVRSTRTYFYFVVVRVPSNIFFFLFCASQKAQQRNRKQQQQQQKLKIKKIEVRSRRRGGKKKERKVFLFLFCRALWMGCCESVCLLPLGGYVPQAATKKGVKFSTVTIQEYPMIPGDNPAVSDGVPVTVAWTNISSNTVTLEQYEEDCEVSRQHQYNIKMSSTYRRLLLLKLGFGEGEIQKAIREATEVQRQRAYTKTGLGQIRTHERMEFMSRKAKDILTLGFSKRKERAFLMKHVPNYNNNNNRNRYRYRKHHHQQQQQGQRQQSRVTFLRQ